VASFVEGSFGSGMILFTRPDYDPVTKYISAWSKVLIRESVEKAIECIDLFDDKANKKEFEGRVLKTNPSLVVLNGHGNNDCVTGQDQEPLVIKGQNTNILASRITYAISCDSAKGLGDEVGKYPSTAYIGYDRKFGFMYSHGFLSRPEEDPLAKPFMEFSNQVVRGLIKEHTAEECIQRAKEVGEANLRKLESSLSDPDIQMAAAFLWRDINHLVVRGDEHKKIY